MDKQMLLDIYTTAAQHLKLQRVEWWLHKAVGVNYRLHRASTELPSEARAYAGIHTQPVMHMLNALNALLGGGYEVLLLNRHQIIKKNNFGS
jgi:hypothetical protein